MTPMHPLSMRMRSHVHSLPLSIQGREAGSSASSKTEVEEVTQPLHLQIVSDVTNTPLLVFATSYSPLYKL